MCGITGFLQPQSPQYDYRSVLESMCDALAHRGPDGSGIWLDKENGVGLGHRRLSIVELSPAGAQPMVSQSGRYVVTFNGEIYNHINLRKQLKAQTWQGRSDTETLLACIDAWGIQATLEHLVGMFSIAIWDKQQSTLSLIRDRLGEKPLYYGWQGEGSSSTFLFASELTALKKHPFFTPTIDRDALARYIKFNCFGGEDSVYIGIRKLLPGTMLTISLHGKNPIITSWWSVENIVNKGANLPFKGTTEEAVDKLESLLACSISNQMSADVNVGAFLSGGIDSSTVVALMQAQANKPINTFSIGFNDQDFNEAIYAKKIADHLGTNHTELYLDADDVMSIIPRLTNIYSEPFADSSQIPTFLISKLARQNVTVALSGDGGDELFGGYRRYYLTHKLWGILSKIPLPLRNLIKKFILTLPPSTWDKFGNAIAVKRLGETLHKGASLLHSRSAHDLYLSLISHWNEKTEVVLGTQPSNVLQQHASESFDGLNAIEKMMAQDMMNYLPNDILTKIDRASMHTSLETRVPFLDHRVVEFAWSLPLDLKFREGQSKWILRQVLHRHVPTPLFDRPKMGFSVPLAQWLRGPLRDWAESLLDDSRIRQEGYFNPELIRIKWKEHLSGRRNWQHFLWNVIVFQAWLEMEDKNRNHASSLVLS